MAQSEPTTSYLISNYTKGGAKRKAFARDPIFGGSCVPRSLPGTDSPITRVIQVARRIKEQKLGVIKVYQSIKTAKIGVNGTKTGKNWAKIGKTRLE